MLVLFSLLFCNVEKNVHSLSRILIPSRLAASWTRKHERDCARRIHHGCQGQHGEGKKVLKTIFDQVKIREDELSILTGRWRGSQIEKRFISGLIDGVV